MKKILFACFLCVLLFSLSSCSQSMNSDKETATVIVSLPSRGERGIYGANDAEAYLVNGNYVEAGGTITFRPSIGEFTVYVYAISEEIEELSGTNNWNDYEHKAFFLLGSGLATKVLTSGEVWNAEIEIQSNKIAIEDVIALSWDAEDVLLTIQTTPNLVVSSNAMSADSSMGIYSLVSPKTDWSTAPSVGSSSKYLNTLYYLDSGLDGRKYDKQINKGGVCDSKLDIYLQIWQWFTCYNYKGTGKTVVADFYVGKSTIDGKVDFTAAKAPTVNVSINWAE